MDQEKEASFVLSWFRFFPYAIAAVQSAMHTNNATSITMWITGTLPGKFDNKIPASGTNRPTSGKQKNILNIINFSIIINI